MTPKEKIRNEVMEKVFRDFERQGMTWDHYTCIDVAIEKTAEAIFKEVDGEFLTEIIFVDTIRKVKKKWNIKGDKHDE